MQTTFIIISVVFCLIAMAAAALPLWFGGRTAGEDEEKRRETILAILRQQAADLEKEREAGRIDVDEYEESRSELERRVIEETTRHSGTAEAGQSRTGKILAVVCAVIIPCVAAFGYLMLGRFDAMDPAFLRMVEQQQKLAGGHSQADMAKSIEKLVERVKEHADDPNGWYMLANSYAAMGNWDDAYKAFQEVNRLVPDNANIVADMADMLAAASGKVITAEVVQMLEHALELDPNQWKALALLAINAWDGQQFLKAADYWERLVAVVPPDYPDLDSIKKNIVEARRLAGVADPNAAPGVEGFQGGEVPTVKAAPAAHVSGTVTLGDAVKAKVKPDDAVFIYARPVSGSKMPVAFIRIKASELPYSFKLTSDMTVAMGSSTLADAEEVIVGARISRAGNFMPQEGDLEGEIATPVKVGSDGLAVTVDRVR